MGWSHYPWWWGRNPAQGFLNKECDMHKKKSSFDLWRSIMYYSIVLFLSQMLCTSKRLIKLVGFIIQFTSLAWSWSNWVHFLISGRLEFLVGYSRLFFSQKPAQCCRTWDQCIFFLLLLIDRDNWFLYFVMCRL